MNLQELARSVGWDDVWESLRLDLRFRIAADPTVADEEIADAMAWCRESYGAAFDEVVSLDIADTESGRVLWVGPALYGEGDEEVAYVMVPGKEGLAWACDLPWRDVLASEVSPYCITAMRAADIVSAAMRALCLRGFSPDEAAAGLAAHYDENAKRVREAREEPGPYLACEELRRRLGMPPATPEEERRRSRRVAEDMLVMLARRGEAEDALACGAWPGFEWPGDYAAAFDELRGRSIGGQGGSFSRHVAVDIDEVFEGYDGPVPGEYDWGAPAGKEVW